MSPYEQYRAAIWALAVLDEARMNESPAANTIRDACDEAWWKLSKDEKSDVCDFSEQLFAAQFKKHGEKLADIIAGKNQQEPNKDSHIRNTYVCEKCGDIFAFDFTVLAHEKKCGKCGRDYIRKFRVRDAINTGWRPNPVRSLYITDWIIARAKAMREFEDAAYSIDAVQVESDPPVFVESPNEIK